MILQSHVNFAKIRNARIAGAGSILGSKVGEFISQELKAAVKAVWIPWGKSNEDSDRNIIKDKSGNGHDLKLVNFSWSENSGYGLYGTNFSSWKTVTETVPIELTNTKFTATNIGSAGQMAIYKTVTSLSNKSIIPSYKIRVSNLVHTTRYYYISESNPSTRTSFPISSNGIYELPASRGDLFTGESVNIGFALDGNGGSITIEQIPQFENAVVTDGVDDLILSSDPATEIIANNDGFTILSMIHQITIDTTRGYASTNAIGTTQYSANTIRRAGDTGIYGFTQNKSGTNTVINNMLGDKTYQGVSAYSGTIEDHFYVVNPNIQSQVAWYGTIIVNKVCNADEINQLIAYYNLDRPAQPQIYYDVAKQGITNDNHNDFNDKLIDYSGNGYDMQLNNISWDYDSGIGKYPISFKDFNYISSRGTVNVENSKFTITANSSGSNFLEVNTKNKGIPAYKVKITGIDTIKNGVLRYRSALDATTIKTFVKDGIYEIDAIVQTPEQADYYGWYITSPNDSLNVIVEQIPEYNDSLVLNGIDDFGRAIDLPILQDYTTVAYRKWLYPASITSTQTGSIVSKSIQGADGAFIFEQTYNYKPGSSSSSTWSFGGNNSTIANPDLNKETFVYQTKYSYNGKNIAAGSGLDTSRMWLGTIRDGDNRFSNVAVKQIMVYPYSMSPFLIDRQLKKLKVGTLYPNHDVFRIVIENPDSVDTINFWNNNRSAKIEIGDYYNLNDYVNISILPKGVDVPTEVTIGGKKCIPDGVTDTGFYRFKIKFSEIASNQSVHIQVDKYIRYEDIVQPYPYIVNIPYTYGDKLKVGDTFVRGTLSNKMADLYVADIVYLNGVATNPESVITVSKSMIFTAVNKKWLLDTPEPLFAYDPAMINNIGIKNLGYLPDISGHNRHLKLFNFAYDDTSGIAPIGNIDFRKSKDVKNFTIINGNKITCEVEPDSEVDAQITFINDETKGTKVRVTGLRTGYRVAMYAIINGDMIERSITKDGIITIEPTVDAQLVFSSDNYEPIYPGLTIECIETIGQCLQFDGIEDYGTVENLTYGGQCLVTKINWEKKNTILYDQRDATASNNFALYTSSKDLNDNTVPAYKARNGEDTYINGVFNTYVSINDLVGVSHVVSITNSKATQSNTSTPHIGCNKDKAYYANFAMGRTMLLPEIPSDIDITNINLWCGITRSVTKPEYYWDANGRNNNDDPSYRSILPQLGTATKYYENDFNNWDGIGIDYSTRTNKKVTSDETLIGYYNTETYPNVGLQLQGYETPTLYDVGSFTVKISGIPSNGNAKYVYVNKDGIRERFIIPSDGTYVLPISYNSKYIEDPEAVVTIYMGFFANYNDGSITIEEVEETEAMGLKLHNFAYKGMSGYNGYYFDFNVLVITVDTISITDNTVIINRTETSQPTYAVNFGHNFDTVNGSFDIHVDWKDTTERNIIYYKVVDNVGTVTKRLPLVKGWNNVPINIEEGDYTYIYLSYGLSTTLGETTIKQKALYDGALCLDGVDDYIDNANIPAFTDYTYIIKYSDIGTPNSNSCIQRKGETKLGGGAFVHSYISAENKEFQLSFGASNGNLTNTDPIQYCTKTNYNGTTIKAGTNTDDLGITIGKWNSYRKMVFYKEMLWSKSLSSYEINMIRNLMMQDDIIDLNNLIFKE